MTAFVLRLILSFIDAVRFIVPQKWRSDWADEWRAEVHYEWNRLERRECLNLVTAGGLALRSSGAFVHALWLRKREWRVEMVMQDLIYGIRVLLKRPGFAIFAVLVLALGIGASTAIFSVVYSVLFRPLPFRDPDRLAIIYSHNTRQDVAYSTLSADDLTDFQKQNNVFESIAPVTPRWAFSVTFDTEAEQIFGSWVSGNFFDMLGVPLQMGRSFTRDEDRPNGTPALILSHKLWQQHFGGDPNVLAKTLAINGQPARIVGVAPQGFRFIEDSDLWLPVGQNPISLRGRNVRYLSAVGRLKDRVSIERAGEELRLIAKRLETEYPATNTGFTVDLRSLLEHVTGNTRSTLLVLLAAVAFVVLIACANVANLLLARASDRQREVAVRTALGADRSRLTKQFLTESALLASVGACAGLIAAQWGVSALISMAPNIPRLQEIRIDGSVLAFTLVLSSAIAGVFGMLPGLRPVAMDLRTSSAPGSRQRFRSVLVVCEIALAFVLLVASGLLTRSFIRLINVDPGYRTSNLLVVSTLVPAAKYQTPERRLDLYFALEEKLKAIPGVVSVGAVSRFPLSGVLGSNNVTSFFTIEGQTVAPGERPEIDYRIASTEYFETMGIPLIRGRRFTRQDATEVAIVNAAAAKKFWPNQDPVGKRVNFGADIGQSPWVTIVGIVGNVRHLGLEVEPRPEIYRPYGNNPLTGPIVAVRTAKDPALLESVIRSEIHSVENQMPLTIDTINNLIELSVAQRRFSMLLLAIFAAMAVLLAVAGIYGVMSFAVSQRTREIGLRMAVGAEAGQVLAMIVREGLGLTVVGLSIGVVGSLAATRAMSGLLFGIGHTDPFTYVSVCAILVAVALVACYLPARRASHVDPLVALRHD